MGTKTFSCSKTEEVTLKQIFGATAWEYAQELNDASLAEITVNRRIILLPPVRLFAVSVLTDQVREQYGPKIMALMGFYAKQFYEHLRAEDAKEHRFYFAMEEPNLRFAIELPCAPLKSNKEPSALGFLAPYLISLYYRHDRCSMAKEIGDTIIPKLERLQDELGEANTLLALGDLAMRMADLKEAKLKYEKALEIFQQIDSKLGGANTLLALGDLALRTDELKKAKSKYEKALEIFQQIDSRLDEAHTLQALGKWFAIMDELENAEDYLDDAATIFKRIEEIEGQADVHMVKALVLFKRHANTEAKRELDQCSLIRSKVHAYGEATQWLIFFADHLELRDCHERAKICLEYAEDFASKARDQHLLDQVKTRISDIIQ